MPSTTVRSLRAEAKAKKIPGRSKLKTKAQLLTALGRPQEAKIARREARSLTSRKTAGAIASRIAGDSVTRRAQIKGRLLRAVKRDINAARKTNPDISQEDLRRVAGRAFVREAKRVKAGEKEHKPLRGGFRSENQPAQSINKEKTANHTSTSDTQANQHSAHAVPVGEIEVTKDKTYNGRKEFEVRKKTHRDGEFSGYAQVIIRQSKRGDNSVWDVGNEYFGGKDSSRKADVYGRNLSRKDAKVLARWILEKAIGKENGGRLILKEQEKSQNPEKNPSATLATPVLQHSPKALGLAGQAKKTKNEAKRTGLKTATLVGLDEGRIDESDLDSQEQIKAYRKYRNAQNRYYGFLEGVSPEEYEKRRRARAS